MKIKKIVLIFLIIIKFSINTNAQNRNFQYKKIDFSRSIATPKDFGKDYFDLSTVLENNLKLDQTLILQKYLDNYRKVKFPNYPVSINKNGVRLSSNSVIFFDKFSELRMLPNSNERYAILSIKNVSNVKVYNPFLTGDREKHLGKTGEWGFGIDIKSSVNISIYNSYIKNCWGDGICIGISNHILPRNILIDGGIIDYSRRNGVSITSGEAITISNLNVYNSFGTKPMAGIDIEPDGNSVQVNNISLNNIRTFNNGAEGVLIYLANVKYLYKKNVNISVNSHKDVGSFIGFRISDLPGKTSVNGDIQINNCEWNNNGKFPVKWGNFNNSNLRASFSKNKADSKSIGNRKMVENSVLQKGDKFFNNSNVVFK